MTKRKSDLGFKVEPTKIQKEVLNFLRQNEISILSGAAGTGKDFLQVYRAVEGLLTKEFEQIVLFRSAVEVGQGIGFLKGDEDDKLAPYRRVFMEHLAKMVDSTILKNISKKIKFEHTGFVRGLSLEHSAVILTEAQNCTLHEIVTIATRISESSKLFINGDPRQSDIGRKSGFKDFIKITENIEGVDWRELGSEFQMRNKLITDIDEAYVNFLLKNV